MTASKMIAQAMLLGAGMGSRMRELTHDRPKPMVAVGGRPLIDHVLDRLVTTGVTHAVVNVHYKADVLEDHLEPRTQPAITISDERATLLDTGGGVVKALSHFGDEEFFIHNSDSIWVETGAPALDFLRQSWNPEDMDTLLLLANPQTTLGYEGAGDFVRANDGRLRRRGETSSQAYVFTGVSIAHPRLFATAPEGAFSLNLLWDRAIAKGRVHGIVLDGQWMHVGTPEAVAEANTVLANRPQP